MSHPRFTVRDFVKSIDPQTPHLYYVISEPSKFGTHFGPGMDFEVDFLDGTVPTLFTITRGFCDRGVQCMEYRPADWMPQHIMNTLRIRFYTPGEPGTLSKRPSAEQIAFVRAERKKCSCEKARGEDVCE